MKQNIGIALSGGGARGIMHIGALHALNELGIFPSIISGSSSGALVAALYAKGISPLEMLEMTKESSFKKIFKLSLNMKGLTQQKYLQEFLKNHIGKARFQDLNLPLSVGVTNIDEGHFEIINSGVLIAPIVASCSIPLLFQPVKIKGASYVDGGLMNNLPIEPLIGNCDKIIGIGVNDHQYDEKIEGIRSVGIRSFELAIWNTMEERMKKCDIAMDVSRSCDIGMFDLEQAEQLFLIGKNAIEARSSEFKQLLDGKWSKKKVFR